MRRFTPLSRVRQAQIHASTVFALTLAIVAALVCAYVFKNYVLPGKSRPVQQATAPTFRLTVASVNIYDKQNISTSSVKTLSVTEDEYNRVVNDPKFKSRVMLRGNQPVNRTTVKSIAAEEPIFEDQLEPLEYPKPVSTLLRPGKRSVIVEVPSRSAMVQVGDHVDVLCTLSNAAMSPGWTGTAVIAKSLRVVARFGTTRTAGQPPPGDLRSYTLESSPYRHAMLELAKSVGATFTLSVAARPPDDNAAGVVNQGDFGMDDPQVDRVSTADLAKLMGIVPQTDPKVWIIERMSGVEHQQPLYYEGYEPNNGKGNAGAKPSLPVIPSTGEPKKPAGTPLGGQPFAPPPNTQPTPTSKNNRSVPISSRARSSGMLLASSSSAPGSVYEGFSAPIGLQKPC